MAAPEEPETESFQLREQELTEKSAALRRISDKINRLRRELDAINERADRQRERERAR